MENTKKLKIVKVERKTYQKLKYNRYQRKEIIFQTLVGWSFLSPLLVVAIIFSTSAIAIALFLSFHAGASIDSLEFVGLKNWIRIFGGDIDLSNAFKNTLLYSIISIPITTFFALVISAILNSAKIKRKNLFLGIFFLPQITSSIATTLIFSKIVLENPFVELNISQNPRIALWIVIISAIWGGVAGTLITYNTAFATIDKNQYEAAELDGATGISKFLNITIPSIGPVISYSLIMGIIGGLGVFDGPYLLAGALGASTSSVETLAFRGFSYVFPPKTTIFVNIGLGTTILLSMSFLMGFATFIANIILPMNRRTY